MKKIKHAYLIIANRNFSQLKLLVELLDDVRNDIYILVDKKSNKSKLNIQAMKSKLFWVPSIPIYWGEYSQVQAEINLIKAATKNESYSFYHFLSGLDLPLANQNDIHDYFDDKVGYNFFTYSDMVPLNILERRVYTHHLRKHFRNKNLFFKIVRHVESIRIRITQQKHIDKEKIGYASNWCSISNDLANEIVNSEQWIYSTFKAGFLIDELFIPSLMKMSPKKFPVYYSRPVHNKPQEFQGNVRYIKWWGEGTLPHTWTIRDYEELKKARQSGHLFSRKFDETIDDEIIKEIVNNFIMVRK